MGASGVHFGSQVRLGAFGGPKSEFLPPPPRPLSSPSPPPPARHQRRWRAITVYYQHERGIPTGAPVRARSFCSAGAKTPPARCADAPQVPVAIYIYTYIYVYIEYIYIYIYIYWRMVLFYVINNAHCCFLAYHYRNVFCSLPSRSDTTHQASRDGVVRTPRPCRWRAS